MTKSSSKMTYIKYKIECLNCVFSNQTMILRHSFFWKQGHLGQSVKTLLSIQLQICKIVYYSESISSSKPVNTFEFSLNFVLIASYTPAGKDIRTLPRIPYTI